LRLIYFLSSIIARNAALIVEGKILGGESAREEGTPLSGTIKDIASDNNIKKCYNIKG